MQCRRHGRKTGIQALHMVERLMEESCVEAGGQRQPIEIANDIADACQLRLLGDRPLGFRYGPPGNVDPEHLRADAFAEQVPLERTVPTTQADRTPKGAAFESLSQPLDRPLIGRAGDAFVDIAPDNRLMHPASKAPALEGAAPKKATKARPQ